MNQFEIICKTLLNCEKIFPAGIVNNVIVNLKKSGNIPVSITEIKHQFLEVKNACHKRVVFTGAPYAGKTTFLIDVKQRYGDAILYLPEIIGPLIQSGINLDDIDSQRLIYVLKYLLEREASILYPEQIILCDRGTIDGIAYWPDGVKQFEVEVDGIQKEYGRYEVVVMLQTVASVNSHEYHNRKEDWTRAVEIEEILKDTWKYHRRFYFVEHKDWSLKTKALHKIFSFLFYSIKNGCKSSPAFEADINNKRLRLPTIEAYRFNKKDLQDFFGDDTFKSNIPMVIDINFIAQCQAECLYCFTETGSIARNVEFKADRFHVDERISPLNREEIIEIIRQYAKLGGRVVFICSDGEPLTRPKEFFEYAELAKQHGLSVVVYTNMIAITKEVAGRLHENDVNVVLKLEHLDPKRNDSIIGPINAGYRYTDYLGEKVPEQLVTIIKEYKGSSDKLALCSMITALNVDNLLQLRRWAFEKLGIAHFIKKVYWYGFAEQHKNELELTPEREKRFEQEIYEFDRLYGFEYTRGLHDEYSFDIRRFLNNAVNKNGFPFRLFLHIRGGFYHSSGVVSPKFGFNEGIRVGVKETITNRINLRKLFNDIYQNTSRKRSDSVFEALAYKWSCINDINSMTLEQKVAQLIRPSLNWALPEGEDQRMLQKFGIPLCRLNLRYLQNPAQVISKVNKILQFSGPPVLLNFNQEGGRFNNFALGNTQMPGNMAIAATGSENYAYQSAKIIAKELKSIGLTWNLAPVCDLTESPENLTLGTRSFGQDVHSVCRLINATVKGFQDNGVACTAKHFPGNRLNREDPHVGLPVVDTLEEKDLAPFKAAIEAGVASIMINHAIYTSIDPEYPAPLSKKIIFELLRKNMRFDGLVITDSIKMQAIADQYSVEEAAVLAIEAGADVVLIDPDISKQKPDLQEEKRQNEEYTAIKFRIYKAILEALKNGRISERRIEESLKKIYKLRQRYGVWDNLNPKVAKQIISSKNNMRIEDEITQKSITLLRNKKGVLPLKLEKSIRILVVTSKPDKKAKSDTSYNIEFTLANRIREKHKNTANIVVQTAEDIDSGETGSSDIFIVLTYNAYYPNTKGNFEQKRIVEKLMTLGKPVIVCATGIPHDIIRFPNIDTYIISYSARDASMKALSKVIFGEINPSGRLPMDIGDLYNTGDGCTNFDIQDASTLMPLDNEKARLYNLILHNDMAIFSLKGGQKGGLHPDIKIKIISQLSKYFYVFETGNSFLPHMQRVISQWSLKFYKKLLTQIIEESSLPFSQRDDFFREGLDYMRKKDTVAFEKWLFVAQDRDPDNATLQRFIFDVKYHGENEIKTFVILKKEGVKRTAILKGFGLPFRGSESDLNKSHLQEWFASNIVGSTNCFDANNGTLRSIVGEALKSRGALSKQMDNWCNLNYWKNNSLEKKRHEIANFVNGVHKAANLRELRQEIELMADSDIRSFNNVISAHFSKFKPINTKFIALPTIRQFGKTGLKFFILGSGSIWFGRKWPPDNYSYVYPEFKEIKSYLDEVFEKMGNGDGIVMIDTAPAYGYSEERIGKYFRLNKQLLQKAFIATKWGTIFDISTGISYLDHSKKHLIASVNKSLSRLGKIDLLYIHGTSLEVLRDMDIINEMNTMKEQNYGGIRYIGASISDDRVLEEAVGKNFIVDFDVIQIPGALFLKRKDLIGEIYKNGISIVLNSPIKKGGNLPPREIYAELLRHKELSIILTGTRNHLKQTIGYIYKSESSF